MSLFSGFKETENYGRLEYSFAKLVRAGGIDMSECSLIEENGRAHFLTKRFDRIGGKKNGTCTSAHQMSVNGKFDNITRADLLELAARNNIRGASQIIDSVCDACAGWHKIAKECVVPQTMIDKILPNMQLFRTILCSNLE